MPVNQKVAEQCERTSEVQMSLDYAKRVAEIVKQRRIADLKSRRAELMALPVTHRADVELRNDLIRSINAQLKQIQEQP